MLALDPPRPERRRDDRRAWSPPATAGRCATATAAVRDLVVGVRVALPDGSVARAGGKVIKNVAGYDLRQADERRVRHARGRSCEVSVRLHPRPPSDVTVAGRGDDPAALAAAASALAHLPLEAEALDLRWDGETGAVLVQCTGAVGARARAAGPPQALRERGLDAPTTDDDDELWAAQRAGQRAAAPTRRCCASRRPRGGSATVLGVAREHGARSSPGPRSAWPGSRCPPADERRDGARAARGARAGAGVLLDAPAELRAAVDPWGEPDPGALELMRRVKARFDPRGTCNPGLFVGGI